MPAVLGWMAWKSAEGFGGSCLGHVSALGGFRNKLDNAAGDREFVHGRLSTNARQLLAD
jgi:hypothetical protein